MSTLNPVPLSTLGPSVSFQTVATSPSANPIVWATLNVWWDSNLMARSCINLNTREYQDLSPATMVLAVTNPNVLR